MVLYQFMVTCIENFTSKVETSGLSVGKKGSRWQYYIFMLSTTFLRRKEWICERRCHQVLSVHLHILWDFLPLNPSTTIVYARSAFYPSLRFTLSLQSSFYTQSACYPWSIVCILHWTVLYLDINGSITLIWAETERYNIVRFSKMTVMYCITQQPCWIKNLVV